jgi:hypothetical protein
MKSSRSPWIVRRCLAWLVWLGLLLPFAQVGAVVHTFAHTRPDASRDGDDKQAPRAAQCDLCLIGAAVGSGAPLPHVEPPIALALGQAAPEAARPDVWAAAPTHPYRSRAPPDASR